MELRHTRIPLRFLEHLPEGIKLVRRHGKEYLVVEELSCPQGHSLMATSVHIHGEPSIRIRVDVGEEQGLIFVDSYWGSHAKLYSFYPAGMEVHPLVRSFCPVCRESLMVREKCEQEGCGAEECILFHLPGMKNRIYVCARLGCPWHRMDISDLPSSVSRSVSSINYFGVGEEETFQGI